MKFHEKPFSKRRVNLCGRTDGHDNASSHFSQIICKKCLKTKQYINFEALRKDIYIYIYIYIYICMYVCMYVQGIAHTLHVRNVYTVGINGWDVFESRLH